MRVWPALPRPGELVRLPLPCPPQLIELSGYTGGARLVALWWSPFGDELMISDGTLTETGRWRGWLCFSGHPLARLFLEPYRLGDSDDEGEHRLLVDRYLGTLDVGLARDVEQLLATQPSELHALTRRPLGSRDGGAVAATVRRAGRARAGKEPAAAARRAACRLAAGR